MTTEEMEELGWVEDGINYRRTFQGYSDVTIPTADLPAMTNNDVLQTVRTELGI